MSNILWNNDADLDELDIAYPSWIESLSPYDIAAINQGGCASGAYMPAVTYHTALTTMGEHGNDVLQYLEDTLGELPEVPKGESWSGIASFYLSCAVELFCSEIESEVIEALELLEEERENND